MNELKTCPVCNGSKFHKKLSCTDYTTSNETFNIVSCETCGSSLQILDQNKGHYKLL